MECECSEISIEEEKLLFDIKNSNNNIEYKYCPHILNHYLNPFVNSTLEKINLSKDEINAKQNQSKENEKENDKNNIIYARNLSMFQNNLKSYNYLGYRQSQNLFNSFLLNNLSIDYLILNNPQNLSINSMVRDGCIFCLNFNDTGNLVGTSNQDHTMEIWDITTKKLKEKITAHNEIVTDIEFFHNELDNQYMLSSSLDKTIRLWKNLKCIHTFMEHNDWVRCLNIRQDNTQFLSGCVSSVVKLWDIPTQRVIASVKNINEDDNVLATVNSLCFLNENPNLFLVGLRNGEVKLFDQRIKNKNDEFTKDMGCINCFKAHYKKLNNCILNSTDKYLVTSSRNSLIRLWDFRKLPNEKDTEEIIQKNQKYIYEYNKHKCVGYNIPCSFYNNEQYIITGSENYYFYIYDILNPNKYYKVKTQQKCINFIKQIPNTYDIAYTGLEDISIFVWNAHKNINKYYKIKNKNKIENENIEYESDGEKYLDEIEEKDTNKLLCNKLIEDIMNECGDLILKIFHNKNLTYSSGINLESLLDIIKESHDTESEKILEMINKKFLDKIINNFITGIKNMKENKKEEKKEKKEIKNDSKKKEINCLECKRKDKTNMKLDKDNNIFNSVNREQLYQLLNLPNNYGFNEMKERDNSKYINNKNIGNNFINEI